jgi:hypothetical protein
MNTCSTPGCDKPVKARGLCATDYARARRTGKLPPKTAKPERCSVNDGDCYGPVEARGLCARHYHRQWERGSTKLTQPQRRLPPEERFRAYVSAEPCECGHGCLLWTGGTDSQGYGVFFLDGRKILAHRYAYVLEYGEILPGQYIDHVRACGCQHTGCVNVAHLEAVTPGENNRRAWDSSPPSRRTETGAKTKAHLAATRIARFWAKTDQSGGPDAHWPWTAYIRKDGNPAVFWMQTTQPARKIAWLLTNGEIPAGQLPEQTCGRSDCMNPAHMWLTPRKEIRARYASLAREARWHPAAPDSDEPEADPAPSWQ